MATGREVTTTSAGEMRDLLAKLMPQINLAIPKHMTADRLARIAMTEFQKTPALAKCKPVSFVGSVMQAAQLGLEPGIMGQAYLIPYGDTCTFIPGWKGLVDLMSRTGRATVWTGCVHKGDEFDYALGSAPHITHRPSGNDNPDEITHFYACGKVNGAEIPVMEVWTTEKVLSHLKKHNKVGGAHYAFKYPEMYGRKVVLLQVLKYMPMSIEDATGRALATGITVASMEDSGEIIDAAVIGFETVSTTSSSPESNEKAAVEAEICNAATPDDGRIL